MRVFVTGAMGQVGRRLMASLQSDENVVVGYDVVQPPAGTPGRWIRGDLGDLNVLREAMGGADAVVHLGAISDPLEWTRYPELIRTNVNGTYNVLETARTLGIRRIVFSSTINTIGLVSWHRPWTPDYVPLDEKHACRPDDNYGSTKLMAEVLTRGFHVRHGMEIACVRFTGILFPDMESSIERYRGWLADPDGELVNRLWSYLRSEDAIEGVKRLLVVPELGFERILLAAPDSATGTESLEALVARHFPALASAVADLVDRGGSAVSLVSTDECEAVLGWRPTRSYREIVDLEVAEGAVR
jgi:UDP-glucose 4-epimerase